MDILVDAHDIFRDIIDEGRNGIFDDMQHILVIIHKVFGVAAAGDQPLPVHVRKLADEGLQFIKEMKPDAARPRPVSVGEVGESVCNVAETGPEFLGEFVGAFLCKSHWGYSVSIP